MRVYLLVVLYKSTFDSSKTLQSLSRCKLVTESTHLVIWDNSPADFHTGDWQTIQHPFGRLVYHRASHNERLSVAYNSMISMVLKDSEEADAVILLDQDTWLTDDYFAAVSEGLSALPGVDLFVPRIYDPRSGALVSPTGDYLTHCNLSGKLQAVTTEHFKTITSGTVVRPRVFKDIRFDERFVLYGCDIDFSHQYRAVRSQFALLPVRLQHDLSSAKTEQDPTQSWRRLERLRAGLLLRRKYKPQISLVVFVVKTVLKELGFGIRHLNLRHWIELWAICREALRK